MKLTLRALARRALWEIDGRSGFKALRTPQGHVPIPASVPDFDSWWQELPPDHRLRKIVVSSAGPVVEPMDLPWHLDPITGLHWPDEIHWTQAMNASGGDLRSTWELNRFAHVWDWIAEDRDAAVEFERQVLDWRASNPFRAGVNWASGQELALRSLAWLAGAAAWGSRMSVTGWQSLVELLYWHAVQIDAESSFATSTVRNNHVLAESLGLAAIADAFPGFVESRRWRKAGIETFVASLDEQFFADGGYCQHSHAYHSYALSLLFEADAWFGEVGTAVRPIIERSLDYFAAITEPGGRAPNYGPNDRVRAVDYGELLAELARRADREPPARGSASFPKAGLHILRAEGVAATLRCGPLALRAGHDDALNLEVWLGDGPVAIDAGSYCYRGVEHNYFVGAGSHNVVLVNQHGPRRLATRFTWNVGPDPVLVEFDARRGLAVATYLGHAGVNWERRVRLHGSSVVVTDLVNPAGEARFRRFTLQWLLDATPAEVEVLDGESFTWNISTPRALITVSVEALRGSLEAVDTQAWAAAVSPTYGVQETATRVEASASGIAVRFRTRFDPR